MLLDLSEIIYLRKLILDNFDEKLHVHDTCGGQYFTLDTQIDGINTFINQYLNKNKLYAKFSDDKLSFTVEQIQN